MLYFKTVFWQIEQIETRLTCSGRLKLWIPSTENEPLRDSDCQSRLFSSPNKSETGERVTKPRLFTWQGRQRGRTRTLRLSFYIAKWKNNLGVVGRFVEFESWIVHIIQFFFLYLAARIECQNTGELGESWGIRCGGETSESERNRRKLQVHSWMARLKWRCKDSSCQTKLIWRAYVCHEVCIFGSRAWWHPSQSVCLREPWAMRFNGT